MIELKDFLNSLGEIILTALPEAERLYLEQVKKSKDQAQMLDERRYNLLSLEIVYYNIDLLDEYRTHNKAGLDLVYFPKSSKNQINQGLNIMGRLSQALGWGFYHGDRFIHPDEAIKYNYVDELLHMGLSYEWIDEFQPVVLSMDYDEEEEAGHVKKDRKVLAEVDTNVTDPKNIRDNQDKNREKKKDKKTRVIEEDIQFMETLYFVLNNKEEL